MTINLNYVRAGSGPDVLLVHGFLASHHVWHGLIDALRDSFQCWAVDLPGFGDTNLPPEAQLSLDNHVDHLLRFCDQHDIQPYAIIGHSMGGMLALKLALQYPDRARRLVLVDAAVTGKLYFRVGSLLASRVGSALLQNSRPLWRVLQSPRLPGWVIGPRYLPPIARERLRKDLRAADWGATISALRGIVRENLAEQLPAISQPTLVIYGRLDLTLPHSNSVVAADRIPHARLVEFQHSHHEPFYEEPERFNRVVREFLLETNGSRVDR